MTKGCIQMPRFPLLIPAALVAALVVGSAPAAVPALAQAAPDDRGTVAVGLLLRELDGVKRVLMTAAHPDDEDTNTITTLARGMGSRTAYLALTRGEGGQNLIGTEFWEGLGIIRSNELVAARAIDGGEQFFTRAIDFGFSKSADETLSKWPREEILGDVVWAIRRFRPQVIVSVFSGTPRDGHGQHQVAGILTHEAFDVAADPSRFPEQLVDGIEPWQADKLYLARGGFVGGESVTLQPGTFDPLLARSYLQVSMDSRSQHRSQDMGSAQPMGPRQSILALVKTAEGVDGTGSFFAGVDTTFAGLIAQAVPPSEASQAEIETYRAAIGVAEASLDAMAPEKAAPALARALETLERIIERAGGPSAPPEVTEALARRHDLVRKALLASSAVLTQVRASDDLVVPGESFEVRVDLWNAGPYRVEGAAPGLALPEGWSADLLAGRTVDTGGFGPRRTSLTTVSGTSETLAPGEIRRWVFRVDVPADADPSRRYYMREPREGDIYAWPDDWHLRGLPHDPPVVTGGARFELVLDGGPTGSPTRMALASDDAARYYGVDPAQGEFTKPLLVMPAVSVTVAPAQLVWALGDTGARTVSIRVRNEAQEGVTGELALEGAGWSVAPASVPVELASPGTERTYTLTVAPEAGRGVGRDRLTAIVRAADGRAWSERVELIDYPHIERAAQFFPAELRTSIFPVTLPEGRRVGYIMGTGDSGPEALASLGFEVELLGPAEVLAGDFARFDALVLGVRAYEAREDLAAANEAVLDFARAGGTVVTQYNQYAFPASGHAPYPVTISRPHDRITDENAAVTFLHPAAPVLNAPNEISDADFEGWRQERGLYMLNTWDPAFTPVLSMADPGEAPKEGSLLIAPLGEGVYIYTGLALFRQFGDGVPGAYRLFANLVSLDGPTWRQYITPVPDADGGGAR